MQDVALSGISPRAAVRRNVNSVESSSLRPDPLFFLPPPPSRLEPKSSQITSTYTNERQLATLPSLLSVALSPPLSLS